MCPSRPPCQMVHPLRPPASLPVRRHEAPYYEIVPGSGVEGKLHAMSILSRSREAAHLPLASRVEPSACLQLPMPTVRDDQSDKLILNHSETNRDVSLYNV